MGFWISRDIFGVLGLEWIPTFVLSVGEPSLLKENCQNMLKSTMTQDCLPASTATNNREKKIQYNL